MKTFFAGIVAAIASLFGGPYHAPAPADSMLAASAAAITTHTVTPGFAASEPVSGTTTIVNSYVMSPIVERVETRALDTSVLDEKIQALRNDMLLRIAQIASPTINFSGPAASTPISVAAFAPSQKIDSLRNVTLTNATVHGVSGLTAADIPSLSYLPLSGGTLTYASSTLLSVFNNAYFGATATSSFNSGGALTLATPLLVSSGGTGANTFGQGWIYSSGGTGVLAASTSPTVNYITATSTIATSTFAGNVSISGSFNVNNGALSYDTSSNQTTILNLATGPMTFDNDSGVISWIDMPVTSASVSGAIESYTASLDTNPMLTIYGLADGAGGTNSRAVALGTTTPGFSALGGTASDIFYVAGNSFFDANQITFGSSTAPTSAALTLRFGLAATTTIPSNSNAYSIASAATGVTPFFSINGTNGNIGIGSLASSPKLYVAGEHLAIDNNYYLQSKNSSGSIINVLGINSNNVLNLVAGANGLNILASNQSTSRLLINSSGNVGIGTTTPWAQLSVAGAAGGTMPLFTISTSTLGFATSTAFIVNQNGLIGIGTSSPTTALQVNGSITPNADNAFTDGNATYRWSAVYAANGAIQTSDQRLKSNISDLNYGLSDVLKLRPVSFTWTAQPQQGTKLGFIAQEVQPVLPETVNVGDDASRTLGLTYTEFVPVIVKAIQQLYQNVIDLADTVAGFSEILVSNKITARNELCLGSTCITESQLKDLFTKNNVAASVNAGTSESSSASTADTEPPIITINGDNPAELNVGDSYADLGASVTDNVDHNLGIHTFIGTTPMEFAVIGTKEPTTYHIYYIAADSAGNTATSTRTVIIKTLNMTTDPATSTDTTSLNAGSSTTVE